MLTIELRGQRYTADSPTVHEVLKLASLFFPGDTEEERVAAVEDAVDGKMFDLDLDDPAQQDKAVAILIVRLQNPVNEARVCQTLRSVFPSLPESLVQYRLLQLANGSAHHDYRYKLEDDELLHIIKACMAYLQKPEPEPEQPIEPEAKPEPESKGFADRKRKPRGRAKTA